MNAMLKPMHPEHIFKQYDADLEAIRASVLKMGGLVEAQIADAVEALVSGDLELADRVVADDLKVNAMEVRIDEDCARLIARRQPIASDLRIIIMVIKTITDLERIGDEAEKIARMAKLVHTSDRLSLPRFGDIKAMSEVALGMLRQALDGFARLDCSNCAEIARADDRVDDTFRGVLRQLITFMMEDPRTISTALEVLFAAKAIERMGDHAKNMSEYVIYMIRGKDVRHTSVEEIERELGNQVTTLRP